MQKPLKTFFQLLKEIIYPSKCALCGQLGKDSICSVCFDAFSPLEKFIFRSHKGSPLDYWGSLYAYEGRAAQAIRKLKYSRITSLAKPLSELMFSGASQMDLLEVDAIVPIPIHWKRKFDRGFNQSELLCKQMPFSLVEPLLLKRTRATIPQVQLSHEARLHNLEGCFKAAQEVKGLSILLIDDVITSGGTANESAKTLKLAGAKKVGILSFAGKGYQRKINPL